MAVIEDRKTRRPGKSYTTQLIEGGLEAIGAEMREETGAAPQDRRFGSFSTNALISSRTRR